LRGNDQREGVESDEGHGTGAADQSRHEQQRSLEIHVVDNRAGRSLRDDRRETGGRCRDADRRRVPVAHVRQVDR